MNRQGGFHINFVGFVTVAIVLVVAAAILIRNDGKNSSVSNHLQPTKEPNDALKVTDIPREQDETPTPPAKSTPSALPVTDESPTAMESPKNPIDVFEFENTEMWTKYTSYEEFLPTIQKVYKSKGYIMDGMVYNSIVMVKEGSARPCPILLSDVEKLFNEGWAMYRTHDDPDAYKNSEGYGYAKVGKRIIDFIVKGGHFIYPEYISIYDKTPILAVKLTDLLRLKPDNPFVTKYLGSVHLIGQEKGKVTFLRLGYWDPRFFSIADLERELQLANYSLENIGINLYLDDPSTTSIDIDIEDFLK